MRRLLARSLALVTLLAGSGAHAELYKWVDEQGRTHYGDNPHPAHSDKATVLALPAEEEQPPAPLPAADDGVAVRQALMRPAGLQLPRLVLTLAPLDDTAQKIGTLRAGPLCRNVAVLQWPDIRNRRAALAPDTESMGARLATALSHFDYHVLHASHDTALQQQRQSQGLLLLVRITSLQLDACAAAKQNLKRAYENDAVYSLPYTRHQLQLTLQWTLQNASGQTLYSGQTRGHGGNLQANQWLNAVYENALDQHSIALLSDTAFQSALRHSASQTGVAPAPTPAVSASNDDSLLGKLGAFSPLAMLRRSQLANVLAGMTPIKVAMTEYYASEGRWPTQFAQLDIPAAPTIGGSTLLLQPGGVLVAQLSAAEFGQHRELLLRAPADPFAIGASWRCETNVEEKPDHCASP